MYRKGRNDQVRVSGSMRNLPDELRPTFIMGGLRIIVFRRIDAEERWWLNRREIQS